MSTPPRARVPMLEYMILAALVVVAFWIYWLAGQ